MRVRVRDCDLHYEERGAGPAVVWIHGFPLSSRLFDPQLEIRGFRHIVPDLPGFGSSPANASVRSIDDYAAIVFALMDELAVDRAVLAGVSMGGYICFAAARMSPQRLAGLMLIDTKAAADSDEARLNRKKTADGVRANGVGVAVDQMLPKMFASKTYDSNRALVDSTRVMMEGSSREGVIAALGAMASRPDSTPLLGKLRIPSLIVVGDADSIASPDEAKAMGAAIPEARVVTIPEAGHLSNLERPVEVNRAIESFLAEVYR